MGCILYTTSHNVSAALLAEIPTADPLTADLKDATAAALLVKEAQPAVATEQIQLDMQHEVLISTESDSLFARAPSSVTTPTRPPPPLLPADAAATEAVAAITAVPQLGDQSQSESVAAVPHLLDHSQSDSVAAMPQCVHQSQPEAVNSVAAVPQLANQSSPEAVDADTTLPQLMNQSQSQAAPSYVAANQVQLDTAPIYVEELLATQYAAGQGTGPPVAAAPDASVVSSSLQQAETVDVAVKAPRSLLQKLHHTALHSDTDPAQAAAFSAVSGNGTVEMPAASKQTGDAFLESLRHDSRAKTGQIAAVMGRAEPESCSPRAELRPDTLDSAEPAASSTRAGLFAAAPSDLALPVASAMPSTELPSPLASPRKRSLFSRLRSSRPVVQQPSETQPPETQPSETQASETQASETQPELLSQQRSAREATLQSPGQKGFKGLFRSVSFASKQVPSLSEIS